MSRKRDHNEEDEVTSKHTTSSDRMLEDIDPKMALEVAPISSRPPLPKKIRNDTWDLDDILDDDEDSE